jgi:hypothetical protein
MYKALFRTEGVREIVYVVPQRNDGGALPLVAWNRGTTPLSSVTIIIRRHGEQGETQEELGPLPPNVPKWLDTTIAPVPANDGTDTYHFIIYTPALAFTQTLRFRRWTPPDPRLPEWAHCYWIKQGLLAEDSLEEADAARLAERGWWDEGHPDPLFKKS